MSEGIFDIPEYEITSAAEFKKYITENYAQLVDDHLISEEHLETFKKLVDRIDENSTLDDNGEAIDEILRESMAAIAELRLKAEEEGFEQEFSPTERTKFNYMLDMASYQCAEALRKYPDAVNEENGFPTLRGDNAIDVNHAMLNYINVTHKDINAKKIEISKLRRELNEAITRLSIEFDFEKPETLSEAVTKATTIGASNYHEKLIKRFGFPELSTIDYILDNLVRKEDMENIQTELSELKEEVPLLRQANATFIEQEQNDKNFENELKVAQTTIAHFKKQIEKLSKKAEEAEEGLKTEKRAKEELRDELHILRLKCEQQEHDIENLNGDLDAAHALLEGQRDVDDILSEEKRGEAMAALATQLESQSVELANDHAKFLQLNSVIANQKKLIDAQAAVIDRISNNPASMVRGSQLPDSFISDAILHLSERNNVRVMEDAVRTAEESKQPTDVKLVQVLSVFIDEIARLEAELALNNGGEAMTPTRAESQLLAMVNSQLQYIERVANSEEELSWIYTDAISTMRIRSSLVEGAARVREFLRRLATDQGADETVASFLDLGQDEGSFVLNLQQFLERYPEPTTREGRNAFLLLRQCAASNLLLRRFCDAARDQCATQATQIKALQAESAMLALEKEDEQKFERDQRILELEEELEQTRDEHMKAQEAIENATKMLLEAQESGMVEETMPAMFEILESAKVGEDSKTSLPLRRKLASTMQELQRTRAEQESMLSQSEELAAGSPTRSQYITMAEEREEELEHTLNLLAETDESLEQVRRELHRSRAEAQSLKDQLEEERRRNAKNQKEAAKAIADAREAESAKYEKQLTSQKSAHKAKKELLRSQLADFEKELMKSQEELDEKESRLKALEQFKADKIAEESQQRAAARAEKVSHQEQLMQLSKTAKAAQNRALQLEIDLKTAQSRLRSQEEKAKREKALFESQAAVKQMRIEAEVQERVEAQRAANDKKNHAFLVQVCQLFKDQADLTQPITVESVTTVVQAVASERSRNQLAASQLNEVRRALNLAPSARVGPAVAELDKKLRSSKRDIEAMQRELGDLRAAVRSRKGGSDREWEEWARHVYAAAAGEGEILSKGALRKRIEERLLAAAGSTKVIRQLDVLRAQKELLKRGVNAGAKPVEFTLLGVLAGVRALLRVRRVSGHSPGMLSFDRTELSWLSMSGL